MYMCICHIQFGGYGIRVHTALKQSNTGESNDWLITEPLAIKKKRRCRNLCVCVCERCV